MSPARKGIKAASFFKKQIDRDGISIMLCTRSGAWETRCNEGIRGGLFRRLKVIFARIA
jgi:hypothetical protein